ncbi:MAG: hypothetical protein QOF87_647 [Pseudonocardiales bacterium]|jgi:hypothetical protein|nr:hypothetical protein [Pseudonocardiales bacterium]MDT4957084.1 hypothetical protein [Pseudonocardiales bacterium]MDT4961000.1 hypothetical protein [Pseudonocardiales bacterium]MDT4970214.1 hypothetical protein [Pseudonocardiales bacterium]MDT4974400.1 hypothetical protein [Pseudonocardiales bacterium]
MQIIIALAILAVAFLVVGIIVTAIKWLAILAVVFGAVAAAQYVRERRRLR